jgi:hypothetical protein
VHDAAEIERAVSPNDPKADIKERDAKTLERPFKPPI